MIPRHELARLLIALGRASVELAPHPTDPERLRHRPPTLRPELANEVRTRRVVLIGLLVVGYAPDAEAEAAYVYGERMAMASDLGMPTHAGSPAWLVAVGESMWCRCHAATGGIYLGHGTTDEGNSGGGEGERSDALRDRQERGRGP